MLKIVVASVIYILPIAARGVPASDMRQIERAITTNASLDAVQTCISRDLGRSGGVTPSPRASGVALDFRMPSGLSAPGKQVLSFVITDSGEERRLTVEYRHPLSSNVADKMLTEYAKRCAPPILGSSATPSDPPPPK